MRIKTLALAGFGPYRSRQFVDFERFEGDGIFLISGKTGAGKSSILDAICYALYGSVPRFDSTQQHLRSDHCQPGDPSYVELVFRVHDVDYRITRTPEYERPAKRGGGVTKQVSTAQLDRRAGEVWQGVASRLVDVAHELDDLIGLSKDQFLQVILLAQNRFQKFLAATNDERQSVLRSLFGTRRFLDIEEEFVHRRKSVEAQLAATQEAFAQQIALAVNLLQVDSAPEGADLEWLIHARSSLDDELVHAIEEARDADAASAAAEDALRALESVYAAQTRRNAASARLEILTAELSQVEDSRHQIAAAQRAAAVKPYLDAEKSAGVELQDRVRARDTAERNYSARRQQLAARPTVPALEAESDDTTRVLGSLDDIVAAESRLPALTAEISRLSEAIETNETATRQAATRGDELPRLIETVTEEITNAQLLAATAPSAQQRLETATGAVAAAYAAQDIQMQLASAMQTEKDASTSHVTAAQRLDTLLESRLDGNAADLASHLVDGEPCPVCGSPTHPQPTVWAGTPVTDADIVAVRDALSVSRDELSAASALVHQLSTRLAEMAVRSGEKSPTQCESDQEIALAAVEAATAATTTLKLLRTRLATLRDELTTTQRRIESLKGERDSLQYAVAQQRGIFAEISDRASAVHNGFDSVSDRVNALREDVATARTLLATLNGVAESGERHTLARATLDAQLHKHGFASALEAEDARLSSAAMTELDSRVRAFDQERSTLQTTLAEPTLQGLPIDTVSTSDAHSALQLARANRDRIRDVRSSLATRCDELDKIIATAIGREETSTRLLNEFTQLRQLSAAVEGNSPNTKRMRLETYVLAAQLEEIVAAANARLRTMTGGRFTLEHDDSVAYRNTRSGLGLSILDAHTGRSRATHSLSGGETFLASLALALGLAEVVTNQAGGLTLDTLFIDEGFGSLDSETLETAMSTLDSLRAGGRTIGLISHVDAMKEQIIAKLRITVTAQGDSIIE